MTALEQRQYDLEEQMVNLGIERYMSDFNGAMQQGRFGETYPATVLAKLSLETFAQAITDWKNEAIGGKAGRRNRAALLLQDLDAKAVAYVSQRAIFSQLYKMGSLQTVAIEIGKAVMDEARFEHFKKEKPYLFDKIDETAKKNSQTDARRRTTLIYSMGKFDIEFKEWPKTERLHLGVKLLEIFTDVTGFIEVTKEPASRKGMMFVVRPSQAVLDFVEKKNDAASVMRPVNLPLVVPPKSWSADTYHDGIYHFGLRARSTPLVHQKVTSRGNYKRAMNAPILYDGVNAIQKTPWKINAQVYDVIKKLWDKSDVEIPGIPSREDIKVRPYPEDGTDDAKMEWRLEAREIHDKNAKSAGIRLLVSMALDLAEKMKADDAIYFGHYLDFRSRCYPMSSGVSPQGSDYAKALIHFANGKPLGDWKAARWLAIHGANVFGEDKVSLEDRVQWVLNHEEEILWCAEDPLKFDWWHKADKPFCFLAFCFEWAGYKRNGFDHVSHIAVALDGTCNGLQHFSAMLRDSVGGASVNLTPSHKPQDIYAVVADRVNWYLDNLHFEAEEELWASEWKAFGIDRKITKRSVMILPYGGTYRSSTNYVSEVVREKIAKAGHNPFGDKLTKAITFLGKLIWQAIGETVIAAKDAMKWLQQVAKVVASFDRPIEWTTPTGFRVSQKYMSTKNRRVKTKLFGNITYLSIQEVTDEIDKAKQSGAIAPNFVHSLDSAAMMLTIWLALQRGVTDFAMIHDSYGTLPSDTETLSQCIREAFVQLYTEHDVLAEFRDDVLAYLPPEAEALIPPLPRKGNLIIEDVLKSDFFFS